MPITINGSGTLTGLSAGGLPDGTITQGDLATGVAGTGPAFQATMASQQSYTSGSTTKLLFGTETYDTNGTYDPSASKFTPNVAGYYLINVSVYAGGASTAPVIFIYKNGSSAFGPAQLSGFTHNVCAVVHFNGSTDYCEIYYSNGTNVTLGADGRYTFWQGVLLRAA